MRSTVCRAAALCLLALPTLLVGCGGTARGEDGTRPIVEIQGEGHTSPLVGTSVSVAGTVTAVLRDGYVVQDAAPTARASSGIKVLAGTDEIAVGDRLVVHGTVDEVRPGDRDDNLTVTVLRDARAEIRAREVALPQPVRLGRGGRAFPDRTIEDDAFAAYEPSSDGLDFYEALEWVRVEIDDARAVSGRSRYGEVYVVADGGAEASGTNRHGGITLTPDDTNPERLQVDDTVFGRMPSVGLGDRLGRLTGVLGYDFGAYELLAESAPEVVASDAPRDRSRLDAGDGLTLATFNILNLGGDDVASRFNATAGVIVDDLGAPALIALQEVQDSDGAEGRGASGAEVTYRRLVDAIVAAGGPRYAVTQIDPVPGEDGGEPGGNIRVGYLYDPMRVDFEARGDAGPLGAARVAERGGRAVLVDNPSRVDPTHASFEGSRKPLAAQFEFDGRSLFVINVHLSSKGGSTPRYGATQPPVNGREATRAEQAGRIRELVESILAIDADARIVVLGDFNEFDWNPALQVLTGDGLLTNLLVEHLEPADRWTYVFQGNAQALDHVLARGFASTAVQVVHVNAGRRDPASDHEPVVARFEF